MSRLSFHVRKGDKVEVITGNHRGSSGKILQVLPKKQQVLIEGPSRGDDKRWSGRTAQNEIVHIEHTAGAGPGVPSGFGDQNPTALRDEKFLRGVRALDAADRAAAR